MKTQLLVTAALFAVMPLAGCASIVSGSRSKFHADCPTCKADVTIRDDRSGEVVFSGTTPADTKLKRGAGFFRAAEYTLTLSKDGYAPVTYKVKSGLNGWYIAGNFFFGGLIGWLIVDPLTGAMWTLDGSYSAALHPLASSSAGADKDLKITAKDAVPANLQPHLRRVQ
jgi:hypothetical protein